MEKTVLSPYRSLRGSSVKSECEPRQTACKVLGPRLPLLENVLLRHVAAIFSLSPFAEPSCRLRLRLFDGHVAVSCNVEWRKCYNTHRVQILQSGKGCVE